MLIRALPTEVSVSLVVLDDAESQSLRAEQGSTDLISWRAGRTGQDLVSQSLRADQGSANEYYWWVVLARLLMS